MALARDGALDLDTPLGDTLPVAREVGHDERAALLTPRMLLAHLGGLPNWRTRINLGAASYEELFGPEDALRFVVAPDTEYRYSGEGYLLLQQVVEQLQPKGLNSLAREIVFDPLQMKRSSFLFDGATRVNVSSGHDDRLSPDKWELSVPLASSTLHTTAIELARFGIHLASVTRQGGDYAALVEPQVKVDSDDIWTLEWGLGLGILSDGTNTYLYHGGNNVIFLADFIYGVEEKLGYALLTNSSGGRGMIEEVEQYIFERDLPRP